jgi:PAS domain S-box-containing protein
LASRLEIRGKLNSSGNKIKLNDGVKRFLAVQIPLAILLAAVLIYYYSAESSKHRQILESYESQILEQQGELMASNFTTIVADLMFLTEYHELHDYLETGNPDNRKYLAKDWLSLSKRKGIYDQIRYIDNKGMEIIRINFNDGNPTVVPDIMLQNKSKRYYFMDTFRLDKGEVYVSPFDLNIERGEIEIPVKPMIRFGTPVFDKDGVKRGIAVLNYFGEEMLGKLRKKFVEHQGQPMLLNPDGYWLLGPRPEKEWGFMYEKEITISKDYPDAWERISTQDSGQIYGRDGLFTFNTVYPIMSGWKSSTGSPRAFEQSDTQINGESYFWKAVSFVPNERLLMAGRPLKKYLIMLYSVLFIVLSFVSIRFAQVSLKRKKADEALKESEARFRELADLLPQPICEIDKEGNFIYANQIGLKTFGYTHKDIDNGLNVLQIFVPEERERVTRNIRKRLTEDEFEEHEYSMLKSDGSIFPALLYTAPIIRNGIAVGVRGALVDLTERKRAEELIIREGDKAKNYLNIAGVILVVIDRDQKVALINKKGCEVLGYSEEGIVGKNWFDNFLPERLRHDVKKVFDSLMNGEIAPIEYYENPVLTKTGEERIVAWHNIELKDENGNIYATLSSGEDITERVQAEETLRESEKFLQTIIDGVAETIIIIGNDYQIKLLNRVAREQMSINEAEIITCHKASHHRDTPCVGVEHPCPLEKVRETGQAVTVLHQHYTNEGEIRYIEILASPLWGPDGSFDGIIETNRDITDRVNAEKELFESRGFFKNIVELTNAIHWELDLAANKFTYVSPQTESILGYPPDAWTDFDFWANRIHPDDREWAVEYCRQLTEKLKGHEFVYRMISKEGKTVWLHDIIHVISENQKPVRLTGIMFDVTHTKEDEEQIKTSLKEKETLIKEIHHRVKNNLAVIQSLLKLQAIHIKDEKTKGLFNESQNRVQSMSMIHERLYKTEDLSTINFGEYIRSLATQLFHSYKIDPSLVKLVINIPDLSVDVNTMIPCGLILNELVSNACKYAFPDDRKGELNIMLDKRDDEYSLTVKDDGVGLPENLDIYKTESLGMRIVTSLVSQINGKLSVDKEGGTKFSIKFKEKPFSQ